MSLLEANDPQTLPERLVAIAKGTKDPALLGALAENPSTPAETLFALARFFPGRFSQNPILPLLLLERANLSQLPEATALALLGLPGLSDVYVAALASHPLPRVVIESALHPNLSEEKRRERISEEPLLLAIVHYPSAPLAVLAAALHCDDKNIQEKAIVHTNTPFSLIQEFTTREHEELWGLVAMNPNTPTEVLTALSQTDRLSTLRQIASNPNTDPALILRLAEHEDDEVKIGIAYNPKTPAEIMRRLSDDPYEGIRLDLACNEGIPEDIVEKLSADEDEQVRAAVARREKLPMSLCKKLSSDERWEVRTALAGSPNIKDLWRDERSIVERLAADEEHHVRAALARNPVTPASLLSPLSLDPSSNVRDAAASNPNTPPEDLSRLLSDSDFWVSSKASANPGVTLAARLAVEWR
jgi:hypothetical protein